MPRAFISRAMSHHCSPDSPGEPYPLMYRSPATTPFTGRAEAMNRVLKTYSGRRSDSAAAEVITFMLEAGLSGSCASWSNSTRPVSASTTRTPTWDRAMSGLFKMAASDGASGRSAGAGAGKPAGAARPDSTKTAIRSRMSGARTWGPPLQGGS
jgi:hypothetical protein